MKLATALVVLALSLATAGTAEAASPTVLGTAIGKAVPNLTITLSSPVSASSLVAVWSTARFGGDASISDSQGNVWQGYLPAASWADRDIFWTTVTTPLAPGDSITVSHSFTPVAAAIAAVAFDGSTGVQVASAAAQSTNKGSKTPSVTIATTPALILATVGVLGPVTDGFTPSAGWTTVRVGTFGGNPSLNVTLDAGYEFGSGTQVYAPTLGSTRAWDAAAAALG